MRKMLGKLFRHNQQFEDYTLRYVPQSFRKWSPSVVAITALGGIAYLADFSIGASIGTLYGTQNAIYSILLAAIIIFITGLPLAYYAARYNIDLDLITRGCGFGFYGSVLTSIIFASFTFIFFALEGSIMAQGLLVGLNIPLAIGYLLTTLIVFPLVMYGMNALSKLQVWTTPLWLILMVTPVVILTYQNPEFIEKFLNYSGSSTSNNLNLAAIVTGAGIALALMGQIGEQIDYLRLMPTLTRENRKAWWVAVIAAGPGWVILGAIKQIIGIFLAVFILDKVATGLAIEPVHQFIGAFSLFLPAWLAMALAVILVVISQIKINVTNAYSGSLAWTNAYTRITKHYPGRLVFVIFNLAIALALMEADMFNILGFILGFYSNCAIAWITIVATDIVINKYLLKISPKKPEFKKNKLYPINPVGFISFIIASGVSIMAFFDILSKEVSPYSPLIALILGIVLPPFLAVITRGKYYFTTKEDIEQSSFVNNDPKFELLICQLCRNEFEYPDVSQLVSNNGDKMQVCSLCEITHRY